MSIDALVLGTLPTQRTSKNGNDQGGRQRDQRPSHDAWRAAAPAGRQQHRAPADDLDDDLSDVF